MTANPRTTPEVAVLVAAYNAAATLPQALSSLRHQTLERIEILCVDDCSTDDTLTILQEQAAEDTRIRVFQTPVNSGHAVARNLALRHVTAPYVCMVDADDWLSDDCLASAVGTFHAHPQTDCVMLRLMQHFQDTGEEKDYGLPAALQGDNAISGQEAFELSMDGWKLHGLYLIRTAIHRQHPLDTTTRLYSDDNTYRLMYLACREVRACDGIYYYRKNTASQTSIEHFHLHRFDFMEANLSLLLSMKKAGISRSLIRRFEGSRWMTFIACYRLFLQHQTELSESEQQALRPRFQTILHTFRPSRLPLRYRWKPGYWLTLSMRLFDIQQRAYTTLWKKGLKERS